MTVGWRGARGAGTSGGLEAVPLSSRLTLSHTLSHAGGVAAFKQGGHLIEHAPQHMTDAFRDLQKAVGDASALVAQSW